MLKHTPYIVSEPLEETEKMDSFLEDILTNLYQFSHSRNGREYLTILDILPTEKLTEERLYDIIYFVLVMQSTFWFEREQNLFQSDLHAAHTKEDKLKVLRRRQEKFFREQKNQNKAFVHISTIWDITPAVNAVTLTQWYSDKRIGTKPGNLKSFVDWVVQIGKNSELTGLTKIVRCTFAKTILNTALALDSEAMEKADKDVMHALKKIREHKWVTILEESYGEMHFTYQWLDLHHKPIAYSGIVKYRLKALEKIILKEFSNREYKNVSDMNDLGWIRAIIHPVWAESLDQANRTHGAKMFGNIIFPKWERLVRQKWAFLSKDSLETLLSNEGFSEREWGNKHSVAKWLENISIVSSERSNSVEFQMEAPGNMDSYFRWADFNDTKKRLCAANRQLVVLSVSNILLRLQLDLPEGFDPKVAFAHLIHDKKMLVGRGPDGTIGFIMADVYTDDYKKAYKDYPFRPVDVNKHPVDKEINTLIDSLLKNRTYIRARSEMKERIQSALTVLSNFSWKK